MSNKHIKKAFSKSTLIQQLRGATLTLKLFQRAATRAGFQFQQTGPGNIALVPFKPSESVVAAMKQEDALIAGNEETLASLDSTP